MAKVTSEWYQRYKIIFMKYSIGNWHLSTHAQTHQLCTRLSEDCLKQIFISRSIHSPTTHTHTPKNVYANPFDVKKHWVKSFWQPFTAMRVIKKELASSGLTVWRMVVWSVAEQYNVWDTQSAISLPHSINL